MKRSDAIAIIEREQSKGHFEPELDTAISVALHALQEPREMCCGGCQRFGDEDANGVGWCYDKGELERGSKKVPRRAAKPFVHVGNRRLRTMK